LIHGETGTGKNLVARMIHERSQRALRPLVQINCADLDDDAEQLVARARGGTVLLDEVGALSPRAQVSVGHLLEQLGEQVRFLATSNHDLRAEVKRSAFRKDLYFRLNRLSVVVPPLRERKGDIIALAEHFAHVTAKSLRRPRVPKLSEDAKAKLLEHVWLGNVRELQGAIERAVTICGSDKLGPEHISLENLGEDTMPDLGEVALDEESAPKTESPATESGAPSLRDELAALERRRIQEALDKYPTQADAAKALDIPLRTFLNRLDALGIERPRKPKKGE
jgi:two-component system, response regulator FlrC